MPEEQIVSRAERERFKKEREGYLNNQIAKSRKNAIDKQLLGQVDLSDFIDGENSLAHKVLKEQLEPASHLNNELTDDELFQASRWSAKVIRSLMLKTPSFQERLQEESSSLRQRTRLIRNKEDERLILPENFGTGEIRSDDAVWEVKRDKQDRYEMMRKTPQLIESLVVKGGIYVNGLSFMRVENGGDTIAVLTDGSSVESLAMAEKLLAQYREEVPLQEVPKSLFKASDSIWDRLITSPSFYGGGVVIGGGIIGEAYSDLSLKSSVAMGIIGVKIAHGLWSDMTSEQRELYERAEKIVQEGEFAEALPLAIHR